MAGYIIAQIEITDPAGFEEYRQRVKPTIEKYGGKYLVRGGKLETLEGDWHPKRLVVLEFESVEQARQWYTSQEYEELKQMRLKAAISEVILVEGI